MDNKLPTLYLELTDQRPSGFFRENTQGTTNELQLTAPEVRWIPASGFMKENIEETINGKTVITPTNVEIRYIQHSNIINRAAQDKANIKTNAREDKILFEKGHAIVVREGSSIGLYDYLSKVFYNENAPDRPDTANVIFKAVDLNKDVNLLLEDDEYMERALAITNSLKIKTGLKDTPFKFNEDRIEAFAKIFNVQGAETIEKKVFAITLLAKRNPQSFLKIAENFEQAIATEVSHAIQLGVIVFDKNTAFIKDKDESKVVKDLGGGNMSNEKKAEKLSDFLKTDEGSQSLTEIRIKVAFAKDQALK